MTTERHLRASQANTSRCIVRWLVVVFAILTCCHQGWATSIATPYSDLVEYATRNDATNYQHAVYVSPWVKYPGTYSFKKGMTVTDLIAAAGGLAGDEQRNPPWRVNTINVLRPSPDDPNPVGAIYCFQVDWANPLSNVAECKFELQERDLVDVGMGACLTNHLGKGPPMKMPWEEAYLVPPDAFPSSASSSPTAEVGSTNSAMQIPEIKIDKLPVLHAIEYIRLLDKEHAVGSGTNTTVIVNATRPKLLMSPETDDKVRLDVEAMEAKRSKLEAVAGINIDQYVSMNTHGQTASEALRQLASLYAIHYSMWRGAVVLGYPQIEVRVYKVRPEIRGEPTLRLKKANGNMKLVHLADGHEFTIYPGVSIVKYLESRKIIIAVGQENSLSAIENLLKESILP